ncbi:hypothetical protein [Sphingobacterium sp. T2]|uniref:hypothetical protein n=1 Tax=Sphingobacterium sp. T2 TaxID=1590596 RepID=UPI000ADD76D6|nr:hypothetical protein [Sphingobacterium sp. T2]
MKKKSISLIIFLMTFALLGVMAMQYYFIREAYIQESQLFDEKVNTSLAKVASEIEKLEVLDFAKTQSKVNQEKYIAEQKKQQKLAAAGQDPTADRPTAAETACYLPKV